MSATKRPLPKRLEEDLKNAPRYKPLNGSGLNTNPSSKKSLSKILDDSVERAMFDEILGPMVKPNGSKREISSANSPIRSYIRQASNRENSSPKSLNLTNNGLLVSKRSPEKKSGGTSSSPGNSLSAKSNNTIMSTSSKEKETSFTSSILTRLSTVEKDNKEIRRTLAEKIARLEEVEVENARLKNIIAKEDEAHDRNNESRDKQRDDNSCTGSPSSSRQQLQSSPRNSPVSFTSASRLELIDEIKDLTVCNEDLTQQLIEMEQFLNDYGLVWVGNDKSAAAQGSSKDNAAPQRKKDEEESNSQGVAIPKESKGYVLGRGSEEKGYDYGRGVSYRAMLSQERQRIEAKAEQDKNIPVISTAKSKCAEKGDNDIFGKREYKEDRVDDAAPGTTANTLDFHLFQQRIQELNDLINSEPAQVRREKHNHRQARLMQPSEFFESVPITVYSNGIMLKRGPFRSLDSQGYKSLVRDVLDGYFPSDLRQDHPDGVIFDLYDKHLETYTSTTSLSSLHTHSNPTTSTTSSNVGLVTKLGGAGTIEDIIAERAAALSKKGGGEGKKYSSMAPEGYMTKEQLLDRLPATKIHSNGDVVDIRSAVGERLNVADAKEGNGSPAPMTSPQRLSGRDRALGLSPVPVKVHSNNGEAKDSSESVKNGIMYVHTAAAGQSRVATIKVKWHTGQVLQMEVFPQELIGDVRQYINRHFYNLKYTQSRRNDSKKEDNDYEETHSTDFELRTAYPPAALRDSMTVEEAKLVPNGTLIARKC